MTKRDLHEVDSRGVVSYLRRIDHAGNSIIVDRNEEIVRQRRIAWFLYALWFAVGFMFGLYL